MLSLETCKKLKEVGFSQHFDLASMAYCVECQDIQLLHIDNDTDWLVGNDYHHMPGSKDSEDHADFIKIPTLSELIEACGDQFGSLMPAYPYGADSSKINWYADCIDRAGQCDKECGGSTPEDAVALLYLELKKNP